MRRTHVVSVPASPVPEDAKLFINRELSTLAWFRRVLEEAQDERHPLLERVKFLSIVSSNLAEFFMVRVAGLKQQIEAGVVELSIDGLTPTQQLAAIRQSALQLMNDTRNCLRALIPQLDAVSIHVRDYEALTPSQKTYAKQYFDEMIFPVLTPLAYDLGRPFPHISNMSLNLAVMVRDRKGLERFARIKVPNTLPRLLPIPDFDAPKNGSGPHKTYFVLIDQVIAAHLSKLFPGMHVLQAHPFRVTRDAEVVIQELEAEDLLETIERGVRERRFGSVVRLTTEPTMPDSIRNILIDNLGLEPTDVYTIPSPLGTSDLMQLYSLDRYDLKDSPFLAAIPPALEVEDDIFAAIRRQDILVHHPYDSFSPIVDFLETAARDPDVLAIKQTLYRVGRNSPVVEALLDAARHGKQVAVLVELKARFDEESNIEWAKTLEREGVHVVYGLLGLKTHSKIALVVRREGGRIHRYMHLATGNYNPTTAQVYTDLGLFTCDEAMGTDATDLFNYLTGYSAKKDYRKFLVAPINLRTGLESLIRREMECQEKGEQGHLIFKMNALIDRAMIHLLYQAAQAGVKIDLIVRSMCSLRPGVPGLSENIRVTSIVGRFLEHSRIYYFRNGGSEQIYIGSADLMPRNLDRRVEILFPIEDALLIRHLRDQVLATYLADNMRARLMLPDGTYKRLVPASGSAPVDSQAVLLKHAIKEVTI
ncbi:MAG: polyphosphate kinase 1 [Chloroflexi bacterium]|nr:polyphosphate kinase 1 [Chloroflexota bacterium]